MAGSIRKSPEYQHNCLFKKMRDAISNIARVDDSYWDRTGGMERMGNLLLRS
jgi:hypothetical protein